MSAGLIYTTVLVAVASTEVKAVTEGKGPTFKPVIAGFILGSFLFLMDMVAPQVATAFCVLIIIVSLLTNGLALFGLAAKSA